MPWNQDNLRFQSDLQQLAMYQRDLLAMLRLKTISDEHRCEAISAMMRMHEQLTQSLTRSYIAWKKDSDL